MWKEKERKVWKVIWPAGLLCRKVLCRDGLTYNTVYLTCYRTIEREEVGPTKLLIPCFPRDIYMDVHAQRQTHTLTYGLIFASQPTSSADAAKSFLTGCFPNLKKLL